ncbi:MAG: hypothetical protein R3Y68_09460 [Rikenellaceae bacterium]
MTWSRAVSLSVALLVAFVGVFFWGRSTAPQPETTTTIEWVEAESAAPEITATDDYERKYYDLAEALQILRDSIGGVVIVEVAEPSAPKEPDPREVSATARAPTLTIDPETDRIALAIPLDDYHFGGEGYDYDMVVNGYGVTLKSLTFTKESESIIEPLKWALYGSIGVVKIANVYTPTIGLLVTSPRRIAVSASIGVYDRSSLVSCQLYYKF